MQQMLTVTSIQTVSLILFVCRHANQISFSSSHNFILYFIGTQINLLKSRKIT